MAARGHRQSNPVTESSRYRDYAQQLLTGTSPSLVPPSEIHPTVEFLQTMLVESIQTQNYLEAQKIEDLCSALLQQNTEQTYESYQNSRVKLLEERLQVALKSFDEARQTLHDAQTKLEQERQNAIAALAADHERELAAFDEAHSQEMPTVFRKFGSEYLLLRKRQEVCVQAKRFVEANALKVEADAIEANEIARQESNWRKSVALQRDAVVQKQMQQIQVLEEKLQGRWCEQIPPLLTELTRAENVVKAAELKLSTIQSGENMPSRQLAPMKLQGRQYGIGTRMRTLNYAMKIGKVKLKPVRKLWVVT
jgi:hypothetical protein